MRVGTRRMQRLPCLCLRLWTTFVHLTPTYPGVMYLKPKSLTSHCCLTSRLSLMLRVRRKITWPN